MRLGSWCGVACVGWAAIAAARAMFIASEHTDRADAAILAATPAVAAWAIAGLAGWWIWSGAPV